MSEGKTSLGATLYKYKAHHVLLWVLYYIFWVTLYEKYYPSIWGLIIVVTVYFTFQAIAFYTTAYFLFSRYLYNQKYGLFILFFIILALTLACAQGTTLYFMYQDVANVPKEYKSFSNMLMFSFMSIVTMVGLLAGAKLILERVRTDRVNRTRDQQRLESELQYLKAQVNPHFLFNAINSVYFLIKKDPDKAAETLIKLSDLLRFQLYDCSVEKIAIEKEIEYLQNFITLEKIRKGDKISVQVDMNGSLSGFQISPFMLMPFVENAFKHVSNLSSKANSISIKLYREEDKLHATIENTTERIVSNGVGGIGLKNVKRRLELLYPESHQLIIQDQEDMYSVQLTLKIE